MVSDQRPKAVDEMHGYQISALQLGEEDLPGESYLRLSVRSHKSNHGLGVLQCE